MNKTFVILISTLLLGAISGYMVAKTNLFGLQGKTNIPSLSERVPLSDINPVDSPGGAESPDPSQSRETLPPEKKPDPTPEPVTSLLTPELILANRDAYIGTRVSVSGIIRKEIIADASVPPENYQTSMHLYDNSNDQYWLNLQNNNGTYIQCDGNVNTCMGYTHGETVTLTGTIEPIGFRSAVLRID